MTIHPDYSINRLVIALWNDAERAAMLGDRSARQWLYTEGVIYLDIVLNIHPDWTRKYLRRKLRRHKPKAAPALDQVTRQRRAQPS